MKKKTRKKVVRRKRRSRKSMSEKRVMRIKRGLMKGAKKLRLGAKRTGAYVYGTLRRIVGNPVMFVRTKDDIEKVRKQLDNGFVITEVSKTRNGIRVLLSTPRPGERIVYGESFNDYANRVFVPMLRKNPVRGIARNPARTDKAHFGYAKIGMELLGTGLKIKKGERVYMTPATNIPGGGFFVEPAYRTGLWKQVSDGSILIKPKDFDDEITFKKPVFGSKSFERMIRGNPSREVLSQKKELVRIASEVALNIINHFGPSYEGGYVGVVNSPLLPRSIRAVIDTMSQPFDAPNAKNKIMYYPKSYDVQEWQKGGNLANHIWHGQTDRGHDEVIRKGIAIAKAGNVFKNRRRGLRGNPGVRERVMQIIRQDGEDKTDGEVLDEIYDYLKSVPVKDSFVRNLIRVSGQKVGLDKGEGEILDEVFRTIQKNGRGIARNSRRAFPTPRFVGKGEYVWKKLTPSQKLRFIMESPRGRQSTPRSQELFASRGWNFLPRSLKIDLEARFANVESDDLMRNPTEQRYTVDADRRKNYSLAEARRIAEERTRRFGMRGIYRSSSIFPYKKPVRANPPMYAHGMTAHRTHGLSLKQMMKLYRLVSSGNQKAVMYARRTLGIPMSESLSQVKAVVYHHVLDLKGKI